MPTQQGEFIKRFVFSQLTCLQINISKLNVFRCVVQFVFRTAKPIKRRITLSHGACRCLSTQTLSNTLGATAARAELLCWMVQQPSTAGHCHTPHCSPAWLLLLREQALHDGFKPALLHCCLVYDFKPPYGLPQPS